MSEPASTEVPAQASSPQRPRTQTFWIVSLLAFGAYFIIPRPIGSFYPFSVFDMYDAHHDPSGSRIVVREPDGRIAEISDFVSWECDRSRIAAVEATMPHDFNYEGHIDEEVLGDLDAHSGHDGSSLAVDIVRRIWRFDSGGRMSIEDRRLAECRAVHR